MARPPDEETPLRIQEDADERVSDCLALYEPQTEHYKADNPTPLLLLLLHLGMAVVEIMGVFGGYCFLVTNAKVVFPKCSEHKVLAYVFGIDTEVGWLCEISSVILWTFPLICCLLIPFFQYWDFCDSRFYYESLRAKLFVNLTVRDFWSSPVMLFVFAYLCLGASAILFHEARSWQEWTNMLKGLGPLFFPVTSFMITVYVAWDLNFFLITVPRFFENDFAWAQRHVAGSVEASDEEAHIAFRSLMRKGLVTPGMPSAKLFALLREEVTTPENKRKGKQKEAIEESESYALEQGSKKTIALLLLMPGYWIFDLLWIPGDVRAVQFRVAFRVFTGGVYVITAVVIYLIVCTVIQYLAIQGHVDSDRWSQFMILQGLMIQH